MTFGCPCVKFVHVLIQDTVYEYYVDVKTKNWMLWEEKLKGTWRYPSKQVSSHFPSCIYSFTLIPTYPHTHSCAYTHAVPPSTRFWYQQWTHCAMTSWCTTSLWLRDLSCWLDQLGQAKPQWPKECCRNWILQCSTYSPSTSLHRYTVYLCDYVCVCCTCMYNIFMTGKN